MGEKAKAIRHKNPSVVCITTIGKHGPGHSPILRA